MTTRPLLTAAGSGLLMALLPLSVKAAEVQVLEQVIHPEQAITKKMELYGALRMSVDYVDSDVSSAEAKDQPLLSDGGIGVSSNTTMIGFRGEVPFNEDSTLLWIYEQQVDMDDTDSKDTWTTRDSFLGLKTPLGSFLVGRVNTAFKNMGVSYLGYFNTTVGDTHALLGAGSVGGGPRLDLFGANSLNWRFRVADVNVALQYAADQAGSIHAADDNDRSSSSAWLSWKPGALKLDGAYIHYSDFFSTGDLDAWRVAAKYTVGAVTLGAIYEDLDPENYAPLSRESYGVQAVYNFAPRWNLAGQWHHADESDVGDDEADQYSIALFHSLSDSVLLHAAYSVTRNGDNAAYRGVDYAHGDKVGTLAGRDPWALSIGAQLKF
ncbi:MAG: porin [Alloalcanivorax xenomutans]